MTECMPGLVAYKQGLLKEGNMQREFRQNRREELKRRGEVAEGEDAEGGSAARRTRGA
jgi:hypothetical protein